MERFAQRRGWRKGLAAAVAGPVTTMAASTPRAKLRLRLYLLKTLRAAKGFTGCTAYARLVCEVSLLRSSIYQGTDA